MLLESTRRRFAYFLENKPLLQAWEILEDSFLPEDAKRKLSIEFLGFYLEYSWLDGLYQYDISPYGIQGTIVSKQIGTTVYISGNLIGKISRYWKDDFNDIFIQNEDSALSDALSIIVQKIARYYYYAEVSGVD